MITVNESINEFLIAKRADGLSEASLEWYGYGLKHFQTAHGDKALSDVTTLQIREHVVMLRKNYSVSTANDYTRQLHTFFKWCDREYGLKNPMRNISYPQPPKTEPKQVTGSMIEMMLNYKDESYVGKRDRAIVALLWDTAMRSHGVRNMKATEINMGEGSVMIEEKGNKLRQVFFTARMGMYINEWLSVRAQGADYLFYNIKTLEPLTSDGLRSLLKRLAKRAGVNPDVVSTHFFRHGSAIQAIENGMDLSHLSDIMGHADTNTTAENYLKFKTAHLKSAHGRSAPSKNLRLDE